MSQIEQLGSISGGGTELPPAPTLGERLDIVVGFLRRRYWIILICLLASLPVAAFRQFSSPTTYTASAIMMIESQQALLPDSGIGAAVRDAAWIESQIGILKSNNVAAYVVKQLGLAEDPQFTSSRAGPLDRILAAFGWRDSEPRSDTERAGKAVGSLMSRLDVRRIGRSYMMQIDFQSQNSQQATKVANAIVDGYIYEQLNAKYQANRRAGDWLLERLQTLREQASAAERAVVEFKAKNNIVQAGETLLNDKELTTLSGNLGMARAHAADVQARLERIETVRKAFQQERRARAPDETVSEAMNNAIITGLRTRYLDLLNREAEFTTRYGANHIATVRLRSEIGDIRGSIRDELGRIEETYRSELQIAQKRADELEKAMAKLVSQSTETNQAQIALFSLEAAAKSYRKIYDNFLQKHTESVQQQSFPISDARLISPASISKTGPRALPIWMMTIFAGGALGVGLGLLREVLDGGVRTREQLQALVNTDCLALVPMLTDQRAKQAKRVGFGRLLRPLPAQTAESVGASSISFNILRSMTEAPSSPFAEAIRSIKLAVDGNRANGHANGAGQHAEVIGLTSCLPNEGKSTVAVSMATHIAEGGKRVILIDCDLKNGSLSRTLTPDADVGLREVVAGKVELHEAVWDYNNIAFFPAGTADSRNATGMLASDEARSVFNVLQGVFDYVIVDLPPLVAETDVRAAAHLVDSYLLVVEWGATKVDAVKYALRHAPWMQDRIVGAVLNKVDMAKIVRYDKHAAKYYHYGQSPPIR